MSIFIRFCEMGLFFFLWVQSGPLSLLVHSSSGGIITSYFFVKPLKAKCLVRKMWRKDSITTRAGAAKGHLLSLRKNTKIAFKYSLSETKTGKKCFV